MPKVIDTYTGEVFVEEYVSKIPDISRGRESFWRRAERLKAAEQYWVSPVMPPEEDPETLLLPSGPAATLLDCGIDPRSARVRVPTGWLLRRKDSPPDLIPILPTQESAVRVMDWCVRNDASVRIVIHWLLQGNSAPYLAFMQDVVREATRS